MRRSLLVKDGRKLLVTENNASTGSGPKPSENDESSLAPAMKRRCFQPPKSLAAPLLGAVPPGELAQGQACSKTQKGKGLEASPINCFTVLFTKRAPLKVSSGLDQACNSITSLKPELLCKDQTLS